MIYSTAENIVKWFVVRNKCDYCLNKTDELINKSRSETPWIEASKRKIHIINTGSLKTYFRRNYID